MLAPRADGSPFVYLDNAATTQKPRCVIDRLVQFYASENASAAGATQLHAQARGRIARSIGAAANELIFVPSTTFAISLVAHSWGNTHLGPGDEIVVTGLEHHANLVPWHEIAHETGATLRVAPIEADGSLRVEAVASRLCARTRLVAVAHVSNVLGTVSPIAEIALAAHRVGARVLVDGAQAVAHLRVDMHALDVDFYAFSAHKAFGPTGIGVLYVREEVMQTMPPWSGGPKVVEAFSLAGTRHAAPPQRFEPGAPNVADALGMAAALEYMRAVGLDAIRSHERDLLAYAQDRLRRVPSLRLIGTAADKVAIQAFVIDGHAPEDIRMRLARAGVEVQAGQFSAQPLFERLGVAAALRMSIAFYNTREDIDALVAALVDRDAAGDSR